ncbi:anti-anti-sigma factor [Mycobacterium alsense]|uniref:STAS domain-containing protein n=1 Tax=Mycobacterium alsense TaxID=324058 RepID=UPI0008018B21|nr:STAS domain-containing protein [Mycobacterium alsense]OBI94390.1 anti-anti-sigma factor [Mycobacterium alsense]
MSTSLSLDTARDGDGRLRLIAAGEIDLSNIDKFNQALTAAKSKRGDSDEKVKVDLSAVEYMDSAAINILFTHADHIHVIVHPLLMPVLRISGLTELATTEAAAES